MVVFIDLCPNKVFTVFISVPASTRIQAVNGGIRMNKEYEITLQEMKALKKKIAIRFSLIPLFLVLIILLPAGTLMFWQV